MNNHNQSHLSLRLLAMAAAICAMPQAQAFDADTGNGDLIIRWDNTLKYSNAFRLREQQGSLLTGDAFSANTDDGNRNFNRGLISNRIDWLSEFDLVYARKYGVRLSAAGWYDGVYNRHNDNNSPATANRVSGPYNSFNPTTRTLHGRNAELRDAFVFGRFNVGDTRLNMRVGQLSLLWGESLFFGSNAIAGAMAPVDVIKLATMPGTPFKEAIMPVPQFSAQWQLSPDVSVGAFYQFRWKANRLPAAGSYFSGLDIQPAGGEALLITGLPHPLSRANDQEAKNRGQGGVQLRFTGFDTDFGLYAVRFHDKNQQIVTDIVPPGFPSNYHLAYHEDVTAYGASASHTFGDIQLAIEASVRRNQGLASTGASDVSALFGAPANNNSDNPAYGVGRTAHVNISTLWTLPSSFLAREASLTAEAMWNRVLSVQKHPLAIDPNSTRDAWALRAVLEPTYRQALPGLDISVPIGIGWSPAGSRSQALGPGLPAAGGGDFTIGVKGSYLDVWRPSISYTHFYGPAGAMMTGAKPAFSYRQFMKDRDFIALSISRTF